jgi:serine/threonine protein kinase
MEELDWSGKGQHAEYSLEDERDIPLTSEKILGHSQTAIVDSIMCRRIRLARKKILCNRRLRKEDAVTEVENLLRLQHAHIVRVVGTYTARKDLAILLYPAAETDLDAYMDAVLDDSNTSAPFATQEAFSKSAIRAIKTLFGCLLNAIAFIHERNVKYLDIKPKNILVKRTKSGLQKVYVADFGVARSYTSAAESETDTPVSVTRTYAAPEVVLQDRRGFSADVFSLGCVFMEMMATLLSLSTDSRDERQTLLELRQNKSGTSAYYTNIDVVTHWYREIVMIELISWNYDRLRIADLCPRMILESSDLRPVSSELEAKIVISCMGCNAGPEPFEAADQVYTTPGFETNARHSLHQGRLSN